MYTQEKYYEEYWQKGGIIPGPQLDDKKKFLMKAVGRNKKVLDIGCGNGYVSSILVQQNEVIGVDISKSALIDAKMLGLSALVSDIRTIPFEERSFDVVLALDILEHLFDPVGLLEEANRILKDDGTLILSIPNASNIASRALFLLTGEINDMTDISNIRTPGFMFSEHIRFFSERMIRKVIQSTGFEIVLIEYYLQPYFLSSKRLNWLRKIVKIMYLQKISPVLFSTWFFIICRKCNGCMIK
jgi:SAM-dependent methyltransferase